jgi:hypothetical protein
MAKRDWSKFNWAHPIVVSASQIESHLACPRRWAFRQLHKLPELKKRSTANGDAFHALAENYLQADDTGRGPDGKPIEMFPEGWATGLDLSDAATVKAAFEAAVEQGLVRRIPGRQVEKAFQVDAGPGSVMGFIDVGAVNAGRVTVEDHKTTKNLRWAIKVREIRENVQMIVGAVAMLCEAARAGIDVQSVWLRHNIVQLGDDIKLKPVESGELSVAHVRTVWQEKILPEVEAMLALKKAGTKLSDWEQLPGPRRADACKDYGGCPFAPICTKMETPEVYRYRIDKLNSTTDPTEQVEQDIMSLFAKHGPLFGGTTSPPALASTTVLPPQAEAAPAESLTGVPPWANPKCFVCAGKGVRKGTVCVSCDSTTKARGVRPSADFKVSFDTDGVLSWTDGTPAGTGSLGTIAPPTTVRTQAPPAELLPDEVPAVEQQPEVVKVDEPKRGPGRPKGSKNKPKEQAVVSEPQPAPPPASTASAPAQSLLGRSPLPGMFILIRGNPQKVAKGIPYILLMDRLAAAAEAVAAGKGAQSFWGIPFFERKDLLSQAVLKLSEAWPDGAFVFVPTLEAVEFREAVDALAMSPRCVLDARSAS